MSEPIDLGEAMHRLKTEAVGFGEDHSNSRARTEIYTLMRQSNTVKHLVLELAQPWEKKGVIGRQYRSVVKMLDTKWNNPFPFTKLIQAAVLKGIGVHCWDPGDKAGISLKENAARRNVAVAKEFKEYFKVDGFNEVQVPGCILLFGSHHFNVGTSPLDSIITNLRWVDLSG